MVTTMTPSERVHAAIKGEQVDRVPFCFWHHFKPEGSGEKQAALTMEFFRQKFDLDIVKIMPDLPYPRPSEQLVEAEQVRMVPKIGLDTPIFQQQLLCIRTLRSQLGPDFPLIATHFSPLTELFYMMGGNKQAIEQLRKQPEPILEGLGTIASNLSHLFKAELEAGVSGIFFSCMGATNADLTRDEYTEFARPYDLQALEGAQSGWLNIVHIHAAPDQVDDEIYFEDFLNYPVSVFSWSDRVTGPSLSEAATMTDKCLMGGLAERGPLTHGGETEIDNEIMSAVTQTKGHHLILANGCSIPDDTPEEWLYIARRLVDNLR